jgi:hypothetical protein
MNSNLKKVFAAIITFIVLQSSYGIDLQNKIPVNAMYILTINGQNILNKMPVEEFGKLPVMNAFCKALTGDSNNVKITELGVNLSSNSYFFVEITDSIMYFTYLFPLSDAKKFKKGFAGENEVVKDANGNHSIKKKNALLSWNNEYGIYTTFSVVSQYFTSNPDTYTFYGYAPPEEKEYYYGDTISVVPIDSVSAYPNYSEEESSYDKVIVDTVKKYSEEDYVTTDTIETLQDNYYDRAGSNYYDTWSTQQAQRDTIGMIWAGQKAAQIFSLKISESISSNPKFIKSQDKTAEASFWFGTSKGGFANFMNTYSLSAMKMFSGVPDSPLFSDENSFVANLHCNSNNIKVDMISTMDSRLSDSYKKMTKAKLNKKFYNYIPSENLLGYYSFSYNTKAILEESPKIIKPYLDMIPYTNNLGGDLLDLYSFLLDEEAIGKLIKGDGVFAVTNLVSQEVPYSTYEYDSSYNYTEIIKTKNETFPEFVFMYSTEDVFTTDKIFGVFSKTGIFKRAEGGYFEAPLYRGSPFKLYTIQKDGIVFLCNTKQQMEIILKGKVEKGLSKDHIKAMNANTVAGFVDIKKILELVPDQEGRQLEMLNYGRKNVSTWNVNQAKPKNNAIHSDMTLSIPDGKENSVKYLFNVINEFYMIGKQF